MDNQLNPKANILIVDDDVLIAESNKFLLKKSGYNSVGIAADGTQAIKLAKEKQPDLILMDINLGGSIDGITAAEEIQKFADIPFIFLTAYSDPATVERAKKIGPFGYLIKPFDNRELIVAIETSLYKHSYDKKIKEQELLFRTIANFAYEWEFWLLPDLQFKYCSPSCQRVTGYQAEEFTANPKLLFDIVHPDDRDAFEKHIQNNYRDKKDEIVADFQFRIIDKQDTVKFISQACSSIFDNKNNYLGRRGTNVDITARKLAEEQLQEANLGLQLAIDGGELGTFDADITNGKVNVNDRYLTMLGYSPGDIEMTKELWMRLIHPEDLPEVLDLSNKIESGEIKSMEIEYRIKHKLGNWIWIFDKAKGFNYDAEGKPTRAAGTHRDITSNKQAEEALRQSEEKFRSIFEDHSALKLLIDPDTGNIVDANKAAAEYYGWTLDELKQMKIQQINTLPAEQVLDTLQRIKTQKQTHFEFRHRLKDGSIRNVEIFSSKIEIGGKVYLHSINHDITGKVEKENELIKYREHLEELVETRTEELDRVNVNLREQLQKEKELEMMLRKSLGKEKELNELKTRFISTASHEFRTPLTTVLASAEMIQRYGKKWNEEKYNEYIDKIKKSVGYLIKLIDDVLTISRTESGKILFNPDMVDLYKLCTEIIEETKSNINRKHNFVFNFSMRKIKYNLDPKLLKFILTNLLSNAFKYSPEGGKIELSVSYKKDLIEITVADEGIGIPTEDMIHLFEPFHRSANTVEIPGTGLGLSIVKHAVELHKGKIVLKSELGKGTTFTVDIPKRQK